MANQTNPTNRTNKMSTETTKIAPINPNSKLYVDGVESSVTFGLYKTTKAKETGLSEGVIMKIAMAAKSGAEYDTSEFEGSKAQKKALTAAITEIKADFKAHAKNKVIVDKNAADAIIAKKVERESEAAAKEEDKKESAALLDAGLSDKALVKATSQLTESAETSMKKVLGEKFIISEDGSVAVADGEKLTKADFANTFATLVSVAHTSDTIADRSAKYEAQVASLAKESLGATWVNLFSAAPADLSRIQKGVKAFETCQVIGKKAIRLFNKLPLSTTRALLELKVTTKEDQGGDQEAADKKNLEAKTEVINLAVAKLKELEEDGKTLTQTDAKNLKADYKNSLGLKGKVKMGFFYIFLIGDAMHVCGSEKRDENLLAAATLCIDSNGNKNTLTKDSVVLDPLSPPSEEILAKVAKIKAAMDAVAEAVKPAVKAPAKGKAKAPSKDELEDEDEDEEEEVKPAAKAKPAAKKVPASVVDEEEDEEEEEEEDDSDDEDEDDGDEE